MKKLKSGKSISTPANIVLNLFFAIVSIIMVIPMIYIIVVSFTAETSIYTDGYRLIPKELSLRAYNMLYILKDSILRAYKVSIIVSVFGTFFSMLIATMFAYTLSRKDFRYRNKVSFLVFFCMLFSGGLVPWYVVVTKFLGIQNSYLALILPYTIVPIYVLFLKGFLAELHIEMFESAKIDGANEFRIFFTIAVPLSKPGIATVSLLYMLMYWNDWWLPLMFIDTSQLYPLQSMIYTMMSSIDFLKTNAGKFGYSVDSRALPFESMKMATMLVSAGPMLFIFPFFQKYFVRGLMVGSVKG